MRAAVLPCLGLLGLLLMAGCGQGGGKAQSSDGDDVDFGDARATDTTGIIRGLVVDQRIVPILGATVAITQPNRTAASGSDGQFAFADLAPGTYFLTVSHANFTSVQRSVEVVAGDDEPPIVKVQLERLAATVPYVDPYKFTGFLTFGAAVGLTSVGTTILGPVAESVNDQSIWTLSFTQLPWWAQGELVWDQTQPAGGQFIWEMVNGNNNTHHGHRETTASPALAYWNTSVLQSQNDTVLENGIAYRFFGGPHPALAPGAGVLPPREQCPAIPGLGYNPCSFGVGITVQQKADVFIHNFYNFVPPAGWRFTVDGEPVVPPQ